MEDAAPVLGLLAGLVGVATTVPYVADMAQRSTRPHRGTWLIWTLLAIVVCLSQRADGVLEPRHGRDPGPHERARLRPRPAPGDRRRQRLRDRADRPRGPGCG